MRVFLLVISLTAALLWGLPGCTTQTPVPRPKPVSISGGSYFSLASKSNGTVWVWGANTNYGYYGNGTTTTDSDVPVQANIADVKAVASGCRHCLALKNDGTVWGWGFNGEGQLGNSTVSFNTSFPVQVNNLSNITAISAGYTHSLALRDDGTVWAWGEGGSGQLGNGSQTGSMVPVQVTGLTNVIAIDGGWWYQSLALKNDGTVWVWGSNQYQSLGSEANPSNSDVPVQVDNLTNVIAIAGGCDHCIALKNDGTVWAWGWNGKGQLGDGTYNDRNTPVKVSDLENAIAIAAGSGFSLALKDDGTVWAWGQNSSGELGNGTNADSDTPVEVKELKNVVIIKVAKGGWHSLAIKNDGTVWAWGYNNFGELGDGSKINHNIPVQVKNLLLFTGAKYLPVL